MTYIPHIGRHVVLLEPHVNVNGTFSVDHEMVVYSVKKNDQGTISFYLEDADMNMLVTYRDKFRFTV